MTDAQILLNQKHIKFSDGYSLSSFRINSYGRAINKSKFYSGLLPIDYYSAGSGIIQDSKIDDLNSFFYTVDSTSDAIYSYEDTKDNIHSVPIRIKRSTSSDDFTKLIVVEPNAPISFTRRAIIKNGESRSLSSIFNQTGCNYASSETGINPIPSTRKSCIIVLHSGGGGGGAGYDGWGGGGGGAGGSAVFFLKLDNSSIAQYISLVSGVGGAGGTVSGNLSDRNGKNGTRSGIEILDNVGDVIKSLYIYSGGGGQGGNVGNNAYSSGGTTGSSFLGTIVNGENGVARIFGSLISGGVGGQGGRNATGASAGDRSGNFSSRLDSISNGFLKISSNIYCLPSSYFGDINYVNANTISDTDIEGGGGGSSRYAYGAAPARDNNPANSPTISYGSDIIPSGPDPIPNYYVRVDNDTAFGAGGGGGTSTYGGTSYPGTAGGPGLIEVYF